MSARRSVRALAAACAILLGTGLLPVPAAAEVDLGVLAALEAGGEGGLWYGPTLSWWPEGAFGADLDVRIGEDRGDSVTQPLPWIVYHGEGGEFLPYAGVGAAIVEEGGSLGLRTDSVYLKGGVRWPRERYVLFAQVVALVGEVADGIPLGVEAGLAWRFGDDDGAAAAPAKKKPSLRGAAPRSTAAPAKAKTPSR